MQISDFLIRVIFIALPGILSMQIYQELKGKPTRKDWEDFIVITLFSLFSYALYALVIKLLNLCFSTNFPPPLQSLFDNNAPILWHEIMLSSVICVILSFSMASAYNKKYLFKFAQSLHITNRFGDEDVWYFFMDMPATKEWVFVRDHKIDLVYFGYIKAFSESEKYRELVIMEVEVFSNSTGESLYKADSIYIARERNELSIEIPNSKEE